MADLKPEARIILQNRRTAEIVQLPFFTNIETSITMGGSTATIVFNNNDDRFFSETAIKRDFTKRQDVLAYLTDVFNLDLVSEVNRKRRELARALRAGNASPNELATFLGLSFTSEIEAMNRIWIDFRGRDGLWYAGFTGITAGITDVYTPGSPSQFTVVCKDMRRFLQMSQVIRSGGDTGLIDRTLFDTIQQTTTPLELQNVRQDVFSGIEDPAGIIGFVLNLTNRFFGPLDPGTSQAMPPLFGSERFWRIPGTDVLRPERRYEGVIPRRAEDVFKFKGFPQPKLGSMPDPDQVLRENPVSALTDFSLGYGQAAYLVDGTMDFNKIQALRQMIRTQYKLYNVQRVPPEAVIADVMRTTLYDFWIDAMGNAIFQRPRYDDLPNTDPNDPRGIGYDPTRDAFLKTNPAGGTAEFPGLIGHGPGYIIGDEGLLRFTNSQDEGRLYTVVIMNPALPLIDLDENINLLRAGVAIAPPEILRLLGVRVMAAQSPFIQDMTQAKGMLRRASEMLLRRLNAQANTMSAELVQRPDLQPGRTIYAVERQKLFYLREVSQHFTPGQSHTTSISGDFGHLPEDPIGDPWIVTDDQLDAMSQLIPKTFVDITAQVDAATLKSVVRFGNSLRLEDFLAVSSFEGTLP